MIIFVDFDDVLFNSKRIKDDLINIFLKHGINREIFDKYYYNSKENKVIKTYDPSRQLRDIQENENIDVDLLKKELEEFMKDTSKYLFEDSLEFLKSFEKDFVAIVSYGKSFFQEMKIGKCGADKYCQKIQITNELKSGAIEKILEERKLEKEKIFFIEDRVEQIEDVKKEFPFIKTIFMRRSEGRYHDEPTEFCDFEASDLKEAEQIIKSQ